METEPQAPLPPSLLVDPSVTRRRFLRGAALAGGGLLAAGVAACAPTSARPMWTLGPAGVPSGAPAPTPGASAEPSAAPSADHSMAPSASPAASASAPTGAMPPGWTAHDISARNVVRRYLEALPPRQTGWQTC